MDFKKVTDELCSAVTHQDLADAMGTSVAAIRQARLSRKATAYRNPPAGWEKVALTLAKKRRDHFARLAEKLSAAQRRKLSAAQRS